MTQRRTLREDGLPVRRYPVHPPPVERHSCPTIVLVTVCMVDRRAALANAEAHRALVSAWREAGDWLVGSYTVMPDHIHLFCSPAERGGHAIREWVAYWKDRSGDCLAALRRAFQRDCWDTQMRTQGHYCRKLEYVRQNPVRKGLVTRPDDWPYQGRLQNLWW